MENHIVHPATKEKPFFEIIYLIVCQPDRVKAWRFYLQLHRRGLVIGTFGGLISSVLLKMKGGVK